MRFRGTSGDDAFTGSEDGDRFTLKHGGVDTVDGRGGDDKIYVYQDLKDGSRFDGGGGSNDSLTVFSDVRDGLAFTGNNLVNVEFLQFLGYVSTSIADGCDPFGHQLFVALVDGDIDASSVTGTLSVYVTGQGVFEAGVGNDRLDGSNGEQRLDGGAGDDSIDGNADNDILTGGSGADTFNYYIDDLMSYSVGQDVVTDFNVSEDKISIVSQYLMKFSQLKFTKDDHGGTIVQFDVGQSVDLEHVARNTLSKSNFTFFDPVPDASVSFARSMHNTFELSHHALLAAVAAHAGFDDSHLMTHAALA